jgi:retinoid hydroxylase
LVDFPSVSLILKVVEELNSESIMHYSGSKPAASLPGDLCLPFVGHTLDFYLRRQAFFWEQYQRHGSEFQINFLARNVAVLVGPQVNEQVLKSQANHFSTKKGWFVLDPLLSGGILLQEGTTHQRSRRIMYPAFHGSCLSNYLNIIKSHIQKRLKLWSQTDSIRLSSKLHYLNLSVACELILGSESQEDIDNISNWFITLYSGQSSALRWDIPVTRFGRAMEARRQIQGYLLSVIERRRKSSGLLSEQPDILGLLMSSVDEHGEGLSNSEIVDQCIQLLFGSHETTSTLMIWSLFTLAIHTDWRDKLRFEMNELQGSTIDRFEDVKQLPMMNCFLKEVERLHTPAFFLLRGLVKPFEYKGYVIPEDWLVMVSPMLTHKQPDLFENPDAFDPSRFAPGREEDRKHPFALIGFGGGTHLCLGKELAKLEMSLLLSILLAQYDWEISPNPNSFGEILTQHWIEPKLNLSLKAR